MDKRSIEKTTTELNNNQLQYENSEYTAFVINIFKMHIERYGAFHKELLGIAPIKTNIANKN